MVFVLHMDRNDMDDLRSLDEGPPENEDAIEAQLELEERQVMGRRLFKVVEEDNAKERDKRSLKIILNGDEDEEEEEDEEEVTIDAVNH